MNKRILSRRLAGVISRRSRDLRLQELQDTRSLRGRGHRRIQPLVVALLTGMVCGRKGLAEVETLTSDLAPAARRLLGIKRRFSDTTLRQLLCRLQVGDLRMAMRRGIRAIAQTGALAPEELPFGALSMDGRGTSTNIWEVADEFAQIHHRDNGVAYGLVRTITSCLISSKARACLDMQPIPASTNENGVFAEAFTAVVTHFGDLFRVVLYDSGANAAANAGLVIARGKHYIFRVQAEQPTIFDECVRRLGRKPVSSGQCVGSYLHGGKVVTRYLWFDEAMAGWHDYPGLRLGLRLCSVAEDKVTGKVSVENRYYVTSLKISELSAPQWGDLIRRHWSVENNCHNTWDKAFQEDRRPWVRLPRAMVNVMVLRRIAYNLMAWLRVETKPKGGQPATAWKRLMELFRDAMVGLTHDALMLPRPLEMLAFN